MVSPWCHHGVICFEDLGLLEKGAFDGCLNDLQEHLSQGIPSHQFLRYRLVVPRLDAAWVVFQKSPVITRGSLVASTVAVP